MFKFVDNNHSIYKDGTHINLKHSGEDVLKINNNELVLRKSNLDIFNFDMVNKNININKSSITDVMAIQGRAYQPLEIIAYGNGAGEGAKLINKHNDLDLHIGEIDVQYNFEISFKTNEVERMKISNTVLDVKTDLNMNSNSITNVTDIDAANFNATNVDAEKYKINGTDILYLDGNSDLVLNAPFHGPLSYVSGHISHFTVVIPSGSGPNYKSEEIYIPGMSNVRLLYMTSHFPGSTVQASFITLHVIESETESVRATHTHIMGVNGGASDLLTNEIQANKKVKVSIGSFSSVTAADLTVSVFYRFM